MYHRTYPTMDSAYASIIGEVTRQGKIHEVRGLHCQEIRPASIRFTEPMNCLYTGASRHLNYQFFAVETLGYLAGWGDRSEHAELLCRVNSKMSQFRNPATLIFDGAYGTRLKQSLPRIFELLNFDFFSRQAVASIWAPQTGSQGPSRDVPCTVSLQFLGQLDEFSGERRLDLVTTMRSNDLNLGFPYDVPAFCSLLMAMAECLRVKVGYYHHHAGSLHVYLDTVGQEFRQPMVRSPAFEQFNDVNLPQFVVGEPPSHFIELMITADKFLCQVSEHLLRGKKRSEFTSEFEDATNPQWHYWKQWADLIRFSWSEQSA